MRSRRPAVAVLGGSFDRLHAGHRALLDAGFAAAARVGIGLTTDEFLARHSKPFAARVQPYATRRRCLETYLRRHYARSRWWIVPLSDPWGRSVERGVDLLIASVETARPAAAVNRERHRRGLRPVRLHLVDLVLAEDGLPVSSRRIRAGLIDANGRRRRALRVRAWGVQAAELPHVRRAFRTVFPTLDTRVDRLPARSGSDPATRTSPRSRARGRAERSVEGADYAVAVVQSPRAAPRRGPGPSWIAIASARGTGVRPLVARTPDRLERTIVAELRRGLPRSPIVPISG